VRVWFALVLCALLLTGCGTRHSRPVLPATYTVKSGDTLYSIAWRHSLDYRKLARWNRLPADYRIYPGQVLRLYAPAGKSEPSSRARAARVPPPAPKVPVRPSTQIPAKQRVASWVWPAGGPGRTVQVSPAPGLFISGTEGQEIRAAAAGKVVYTGSGLRGFGQLVIIKHTEVFLSAYAHNRALSVKEGDQVKGGQAIGEMGLGPRQEPALYFEIRINGQPVDPLQFLPRR
jgi:lipoprotein NlpD